MSLICLSDDLLSFFAGDAFLSFELKFLELAVLLSRVHNQTITLVLLQVDGRLQRSRDPLMPTLDLFFVCVRHLASEQHLTKGGGRPSQVEETA